MPEEEKINRESAAENFGKMLETFGSAISEIFNDPKLKEKANDFAKSATESAETFIDRFKDEEVKAKFRDVGKAAQDFGKSVANYFKEEDDKRQDESSSEETPPSVSKSVKGIGDRIDDYFKNTRSGRITSSSLAISWDIILLIFFGFFSKYIAYYQPETVRGVTEWKMYPILTPEFNSWLPILFTTLILSIIGHSILIAFDRYLWRQVALIVLNLFGIATVITLLSIYPFNFSIIPNSTTATVAPIITTLVLIGILVGLGIGTLVSFIKLIVEVATKKPVAKY